MHGPRGQQDSKAVAGTYRTAYVVILERLFKIPYLREDKRPIVQSQGIVRLPLENLPEILNGSLYILCLIPYQSPVEICECICRIYTYCPVQISESFLIPVLGIIDTGASYISFRLPEIQFDGLVVVPECLCGVS